MSRPAVEIRPRRSMALFAILAILMVIGSYVFVLLLAAACVYLPYLILSNSNSFGFQLLAIFLFGIAIAGTMLWSLIPRRDKFEPPGMLLDRSSQPRLFAEIDDIAAALNEPLPQEVYLIGQVNAFVADRGGLIGFGSRRVMGLGLPLLSILTVSQFRAVLAHEFAHYYGGDTSLGPWVYKTKTAIMRIFENIGSLGGMARMAVLGIMYMVVANVLKWYFILFLRAINLVSRQQEYRADELACLVAGRQPLIDGLRSINSAAMAWPAYWNTEVAPVLNDGSLPAIGDGFSRFVAAPEISRQLEQKLQELIQKPQSNPYNTHPPLPDRISALQKLAEGFDQTNTSPASSLLNNLPATEMRFIQDRIPDLRARALNYVSWNEVALRVTIPAWRKFAGTYTAVLKGVTAELLFDQIPKLREIGSGIPDPKGMLLTPAQRTHRAGQLFGSALALALIETGWELQAQPGDFHIRRAGQELNPFLIIDQMVAGKLARDAWLSQCRELGISDLALCPAERESKPADSSQQPSLFVAEVGSEPASNC